jgi:hypothetical protein
LASVTVARDDLPLVADGCVVPVGAAGGLLIPPVRFAPLLAVRTAGCGFSTMRIGSLSALSAAASVEDVGGEGSAETEIRPLPAAAAGDAAGAAAAELAG